MWEREDYVFGREERTGTSLCGIVLIVAWSGDYVSSILRMRMGLMIRARNSEVIHSGKSAFPLYET